MAMRLAHVRPLRRVPRSPIRCDRLRQLNDEIVRERAFALRPLALQKYAQAGADVVQHRIVKTVYFLGAP